MVNKKDRRHSGRAYPYITIKGKKEDILNECLDPQEYWNDWDDRRDGMRNISGDKSKIKASEYTNNLKIPTKESTFLKKFTKTYILTDNFKFKLYDIYERKNWGWNFWQNNNLAHIHNNNQKLKMLLKRRKQRKNHIRNQKI